MHHGTTQQSLYSATGQRKYLTPRERERFITASHALKCAGDRSFCLTLAQTGCRISEALLLTKGAIASDEGFIAIPCLKKRSRAVIIREVPVPPDLIALLAAAHHLDDGQPSERLWTFSRTRAWELVKEVMAKAQIPLGCHACPKGLRHGFGIHAIRRAVPINLVQRWLGHARLETTTIYLHAIGEEERLIAARMWQ